MPDSRSGISDTFYKRAVSFIGESWIKTRRAVLGGFATARLVGILAIGLPETNSTYIIWSIEIMGVLSSIALLRALKK